MAPPPVVVPPYNAVFRRTILSNPSAPNPSNPNRSTPEFSTLRTTVNLPHHSAFTPVMLPRPSPDESAEAARQRLDSVQRMHEYLRIPIEMRDAVASAAATAASGSNRVLLSPRRSTETGASSSRYVSFSAPFAIPSYLLHSKYASTFTTHTGHGDLLADERLEGKSTTAREHSTQAKGKQVLLPTRWNNEDRCVLLDLDSDGLQVSFGGSAKYGDRDAGSIRTNAPIPDGQAGVYYFEITIVSRGKSGYIGIGFSLGSVSLSRLPGWESSSWGYHGDDGRKFCSLGTGGTFGPTFTTGDVIGCGIDWTGEGRAFFTKNGDFIGYAFQDLRGQGKLYPSVGLRTPGEVIKANFGATPFQYDIDSYVVRRQSDIRELIEQVVIPKSILLPPSQPPIPSFNPPSTSVRVNDTLQFLVGSYLAHYGYTSAASSFSHQVTQERFDLGARLVSTPLASDKVDVEPMDIEMEAEAAPSDLQLRSQIRRAVLAGQAQSVLDLTERHFPVVLATTDETGGILLKLRLRVFVEKVILMRMTPEPTKGKGKRKMDEAEDDTLMLADDSGTTAGLDELLELGRTLDGLYGSDERPHVVQALKETFSLLAYERPEHQSGRIGWLLSQAARTQLADDLNAAILQHLGASSSSRLEALYRQMGAVVSTLGEWDCGSAALVDTREILFPSS